MESLAWIRVTKQCHIDCYGIIKQFASLQDPDPKPCVKAEPKARQNHWIKTLSMMNLSFALHMPLCRSQRPSSASVVSRRTPFMDTSHEAVPYRLLLND